jgi:hypothetical protein
MGLHTGVYQPVTINPTDGRARLPPSVLTAAKAVGDAAHGGQVILSETTFRALRYGNSVRG